MQRDFTYVADLVQAIERLIHVAPPRLDQSFASLFCSLSDVTFRVVNIGNSKPGSYGIYWSNRWAL